MNDPVISKLLNGKMIIYDDVFIPPELHELVMDVKNLGFKNTYKRLYTHWGLNQGANLGAKKWSLITRHHSGTKSDYWSPEIHISKGESSKEIQELAMKFNS